MPRYTFDEIKQPARKRVPCDACGKKITRQRTFTMTLNPYNKNPDGTVRTRQDIREALLEKKREWEAKQDGEQCTPCYNVKWGINS